MQNTTFWPRSGGDEGNRSQIPAPGPTNGVIVFRTTLRGAPPGLVRDNYPQGGGAVASDSTLRVADRGFLTALTPAGEILWELDLIASGGWREEEEEDSEEDAGTGDNQDDGERPPRPHHHSAPAVVRGTSTLITIDNTALIVDASGQIVDQIEVDLLDDTGLAPNVGRDGVPILTTIAEGFTRWEPGGPRKFFIGGYDIPPVALFTDGTLAVAAYAGRGFCRLTPEGEIVWRTKLKDADLLPTVSSRQNSAVASLNDGCSVFFGPDGEELGRYPGVAVFAEHPEGGWVARSYGSVARLGERGEVIWERGTPDARYKRHQPLVDSRGAIYALAGELLIALTGAGEVIFELPLGPDPTSIFPVRPCVIGALVGGELLLIE